MSFNWKASGLFAAGVAFGTAGIKILSSKDAKRAYTQCTAAALRAKDCVMKTVNTVQENAEDILAEAKSINEEREAKAEAAKVADAAEDVLGGRVLAGEVVVVVRGDDLDAQLVAQPDDLLGERAEGEEPEVGVGAVGEP